MLQKAYHIQIIEEELSRRIDRNSSYSLRAFSSSLGIAPGHLSLILNGKRPLSLEMAQVIENRMELAPEVRDQFYQSILKEQKNRSLQKVRKLSFIDPDVEKSPEEKKAIKKIQNEMFRVIGDWYHYALIEMTQLVNYQSSIKWMSSQLNISEMEVKLALDRLTKLGLLQKDKNGKLVKTSAHFISEDKKMTNSALKKLQKTLLRMAIESIDNVEYEFRAAESMTMAIDPSKLPKAKMMIHVPDKQQTRYFDEDPDIVFYSRDLPTDHSFQIRTDVFFGQNLSGYVNYLFYGNYDFNNFSTSDKLVYYTPQHALNIVAKNLLEAMIRFENMFIENAGPYRDKAISLQDTSSKRDETPSYINVLKNSPDSGFFNSDH